MTTQAVVLAGRFLAQSRPMKQDHRFLSELGLLRAALLLAALVNLAPPLVVLLAGSGGDGAWPVITGLVAPVMAPILVVVLLFDYIMSRVRAADAQGSERERFQRIARIELTVIGLTLATWVPFFASRFA